MALGNVSIIPVPQIPRLPPGQPMARVPDHEGLGTAQFGEIFDVAAKENEGHRYAWHLPTTSPRQLSRRPPLHPNPSCFMGASLSYLPEPVTDKETSHGEILGMEFAASCNALSRR